MFPDIWNLIKASKLKHLIEWSLIVRDLESLEIIHYFARRIFFWKYHFSKSISAKIYFPNKPFLSEMQLSKNMVYSIAKCQVSIGPGEIRGRNPQQGGGVTSASVGLGESWGCAIT